MLAIVIAAALAAPTPIVPLLDPNVATTCAVISSVKGAEGNSYTCCESCALGMLRATSWITVETENWKVETLHDAQSISNYVVDDDLWNDSSRPPRGSGLAAESHDTVEKDTVVTKVTRPCGHCINYDDCLAAGGHVNTWHRTCSLLMT